MASSGRVNIGTCKILLVCGEPHHVYQVWWILAPPIDAQRHGAFCLTGVQRRLQYCRYKCQRLQYCLCQGGCGALFQQAYRVWFWYRSLTCALPSLFAPGPFRAGVPGRMAPVGLGCASRRRAVNRLPTGPRSESWGRSRKQRFGPGLPIRETARRRLVPEASAPVGEVGRRS